MVMSIKTMLLIPTLPVIGLLTIVASFIFYLIRKFRPKKKINVVAHQHDFDYKYSVKISPLEKRVSTLTRNKGFVFLRGNVNPNQIRGTVIGHILLRTEIINPQYYITASIHNPEFITTND